MTYVFNNCDYTVTTSDQLTDSELIQLIRIIEGRHNSNLMVNSIQYFEPFNQYIYSLHGQVRKVTVYK